MEVHTLQNTRRKARAAIDKRPDTQIRNLTGKHKAKYSNHYIPVQSSYNAITQYNYSIVIGVCRDTLSAYWEEGYERYFDGSGLLTPALHPELNMSALPQIGLVRSLGYVVCGFLPTRIAFPSLSYVLLGQSAEIPSEI